MITPRRTRALVPASLILLVLVAAWPTAAVGDAATLQPGDRVRNASGGGCTLNFVFDGVGALDGRVFMGTAAHCLDSLGEAVTNPAFGVIGHAAFVGDEEEGVTDFAFIEILPTLHGRVKADMRGHPGVPQGFTQQQDTWLGDRVLQSGYGIVFHTLPETRERRQGVLIDDTQESYWIHGAVIFGDSGGPLVHAASGNALGVVSRGFVHGHSGPTVEGVLEKAADAGFPVALRVAE